MKRHSRLIRLAVAIVLAMVAGLLRLLSDAPITPSSNGESGIVRAIEQRLSDQIVETDARVTRLLADDNHGSRHQRLLIDVDGHSVLIAHNIDLAPRVPLKRGDTIRVRGEFEWNDKGGVIHWTHHDPKRRHPAGWIEHDGRRYE